MLPRNGRNEVFYLDFKPGRMIDIEKPASLIEAEKEIPINRRVNAMAQIREMENGTRLTRVMLGMAQGTYADTMLRAAHAGLVRREPGSGYVVIGERIPTKLVDIT